MLYFVPAMKVSMNYLHKGKFLIVCPSWALYCSPDPLGSDQTTQLLAATGYWWLHSGHLHFKCSNKLAITQEHSLLRYCALHLLRIHVLKQEFSVGLFW